MQKPVKGNYRTNHHKQRNQDETQEQSLSHRQAVNARHAAIHMARVRQRILPCRISKGRQLYRQGQERPEQNHPGIVAAQYRCFGSGDCAGLRHRRIRRQPSNPSPAILDKSYAEACEPEEFIFDRRARTCFNSS